jgi:hypothetical protein
VASAVVYPPLHRLRAALDLLVVAAIAESVTWCNPVGSAPGLPALLPLVDVTVLLKQLLLLLLLWLPSWMWMTCLTRLVTTLMSPCQHLQHVL